MTLRAAFTFSLFAFTTACSVARPATSATDICAFPLGTVKPVDVDIGVRANVQASATVADPDLEAFYDRAFSRAAPLTLRSGQPARQLVLSGGGQDGAFGTGFLDGMGDDARYNLVTGVSTGALQATFALLGPDPSPSENFPKDGDFPPRQPDASAIDDLVAGYTITRAESIATDGGLLRMITKASGGSFAPLHKCISVLMSDPVLDRLRDMASKPSRPGLFAALLNWDSGKVEVVDLMEYVAVFRGSNAQLRDCYARILVAASSEPLGVPPVAIGRSLYADAGLRFGVVSPAALSSAQRAGFATDIIVNGTLLVAGHRQPPPFRYNVLDTANRARRILVNQVYRYSVAEVTRRAHQQFVRVMYIPEVVADKKGDRKGAFIPDYMATLIADGREAGAKGKWMLVCPPGQPCTAPPQ
jgi:hypothetical protein